MGEGGDEIVVGATTNALEDPNFMKMNTVLATASAKAMSCVYELLIAKDI